MNSQLHAPAALPPGKEPTVSIVQEAGWAPELVWTMWIWEHFYLLGLELQPVRRVLATYPERCNGLVQGRYIEVGKDLKFCLRSEQDIQILKKKTPWPESASELYRPSERRLSAKLVLTHADTGCHVVSVTDP
jgi:hypothetical protein